MKGKDGIARAVYVTAIGRRVVVVHVFQKKTQKTPRKEIEIALRRARGCHQTRHIRIAVSCLVFCHDD
jgi:phage-related protein